MEELYLYIAERLANEVPGLVTIDEDTGQLIETGDQYPVLFPCALINVADIQWESDKYASEQRGDVTVTVKNAFSCYEDTHLSSQPSRDGFVRLKERNRMHKKICKFDKFMLVLVDNGFRFVICFFANIVHPFHTFFFKMTI